ncbi:hypothetical protein L1887_63010 [Cichorium endivia]|nr:hypothetical protein L1887_63010 [Cichorium endivia]
MQFTGKPYHRETLEEVGKDDDDDDEEDDSDDSEQSTGDHVVYDSRGLEVPPANRIWYLGRFCAQNARTAHALQHWRYHLYEWVVEWLHNQKYDTAKELKRRDKMSTKKRRKHANKIVDRMVDDGVVKKLWKEFRTTIDDAANAKQGRFEVWSARSSRGVCTRLSVTCLLRLINNIMMCIIVALRPAPYRRACGCENATVKTTLSLVTSQESGPVCVAVPAESSVAKLKRTSRDLARPEHLTSTSQRRSSLPDQDSTIHQAPHQHDNYNIHHLEHLNALNQPLWV